MRYQMSSYWLYWIFTGYLIVNRDKFHISWKAFAWWAIFGLTMVVGKDLWERWHSG